ncbi:MAG: glycosyltransferase family 4 protein [bacterium]|nr:glycosyltransferase family 4 protein [bacterium]
MANSQFLLSLGVAVLSALLSMLAIKAIRPLMLRHALAQPNARSSHRVPTPQGAGIAVIAATLVVAGTVIVLTGMTGMQIPVTVFGATLFIAIVGLVDDVHSISVLPRLLLQGAAVAAIVFSAPDELRITPWLPLSIERAAILLAGLWFVNLVNFMDGLDLMTAAEAVPISVAIVLFGWLGDVPPPVTIVAAALCGALFGFVPFNRPVAKIFLGDVGSLPIGLLLGWCLLELAWQQKFAAALLLPLYYLADATLTLFRRIARHEPFWAAHRSHYYQRATDNGFTVWGVVGHVFLLNLFLASLAIASTRHQSTSAAILYVVAGAAAVFLVLYRFSSKRPRGTSSA